MGESSGYASLGASSDDVSVQTPTKRDWRNPLPVLLPERKPSLKAGSSGMMRGAGSGAPPPPPTK